VTLGPPSEGVRRAVEVVDEVRLDEAVDRPRTTPVVRQRLRLPGGDHPPLAVERTVAAGGATGPAVLLIHGLAQNRFTWRVSGRSFPAWLASLGFEVLNLELRGHGDSRAYGAGNARSFDEYVVDAVRVIDLCEAPPFLVGHSLGGAVGIAAATERRLRGLVHLAGVYGFAEHNRVLRSIARLTLLAEPVLRQAPVRVHTRWTGGLVARLYSLTDILGYGAPIAGWSPGSIERDLLEERLVSGFDWTSVEVWLQMSRWATGEPLAWAEAFRALDVPLLVACGDADPLVRPADARRCHDESGSSDKELVVFDRFDHKVHWGHVDLILGQRAPEVVWPKLAGWMSQRC
jgi:polyhydroxyalkanoate synthase subunit PhaC